MGRIKDLNTTVVSLNDFFDFIAIGNKNDGEDDYNMTLQDFFNAIGDFLKDVNNTQTNKTIDADNNTITNIGNDEIKSSAGINFSKMETLTPERAIMLDASGKIIASGVTTTELNKLAGLTKTTQELNESDSTLRTAKIMTGFSFLYETEVTGQTGDTTITALMLQNYFGWNTSNEFPSVGIILSVWEDAGGGLKWNYKDKTGFYVTPQTVNGNDVLSFITLSSLTNGTVYKIVINCSIVNTA